MCSRLVWKLESYRAGNLRTASVADEWRCSWINTTVKGISISIGDKKRLWNIQLAPKEPFKWTKRWKRLYFPYFRDLLSVFPLLCSPATQTHQLPLVQISDAASLNTTTTVGITRLSCDYLNADRTVCRGARAHFHTWLVAGKTTGQETGFGIRTVIIVLYHPSHYSLESCSVCVCVCVCVNFEDWPG